MIKYLQFVITLTISMFHYAYSKQINLEKYYNDPCTIKGLIPEAQYVIDKNISTCFLEISDVVKTLCPFEQGVLVNALYLNTDTTRCFDFVYYRSNIKSALKNNLRTLLPYTLGTSRFNMESLQCINKSAEKLLLSSELTQIHGINSALQKSQTLEDSQTASFIETMINVSLDVRRNFIRPIDQWKIMGGYESGKIQYFKYTSSNIRTLVSSFLNLILKSYNNYNGKLSTSSIYSKLFSTSKNCANYDNKIKEYKMVELSKNITSVPIVSSNSTITESGLLSFQYSEFPNSFTSILKNFTRNIIAPDLINEVKLRDNDPLVQKFISEFDKIKFHNITCFPKSTIELITKLNRTHPMFETFYNILINKQKEIEVLDTMGYDKETKQYMEKLNSIVRNFYNTNNLTIKANFSFTDFTELENNIKINLSEINEEDLILPTSNINPFVENTPTVSLFRRMISYPYRSPDNYDLLEKLIYTIKEELDKSPSLVKIFPGCMSNSTCGFRDEINNMILYLPSNYYKNLNNAITLINALRNATNADIYYPNGIDFNIQEIKQFMPLNVEEGYAIYDNGVCHIPNSLPVNCTDLFIYKQQDLYFGRMSYMNKELHVIHSNLDIERYNIVYGEMDMCMREDIAYSIPSYFNIKPICREILESDCPDTLLDRNYEVSATKQIQIPELYKCSLKTTLRSQENIKKCFEFILDSVFDPSGFQLSELSAVSMQGIIISNLKYIFYKDSDHVSYQSVKPVKNSEIINDEDAPEDLQSIMDEFRIPSGTLIINDSTSLSISKINIPNQLNLFGERMQEFYRTGGISNELSFDSKKLSFLYNSCNYYKTASIYLFAILLIFA